MRISAGVSGRLIRAINAQPMDKTGRISGLNALSVGLLRLPTTRAGKFKKYPERLFAGLAKGGLKLREAVKDGEKREKIGSLS